MKWHYYLRDDALVIRANASKVEYWGLIGWTDSARHKNRIELLKNAGTRVTKITERKANLLISA